jgi:hypothetical protein
MFRQETLDGIGTQTSAVDAGEEYIAISVRTFS